MTQHRLVLPLASLALACAASAQVPQGHYVFGTFGGAPQLQKGIFFTHPRNPDTPTSITGLRGDLIVTGASCILHRTSDGALLVGERAPVGGSVDLHLIELDGNQVRLDASFSVGTGGSCCGEIPQMALLPDGRVLVAATDVDAGPLRNYLTTNYGWQGLGTVDLDTGLVSSIPISNGASIVDVFNGMALAPDASAAYLGTYVSSTQGDIWRVPLPAGGAATLVASVPSGLSNMAFDNNGELLVTTLDANGALFRVDVSTGAVNQITQTNGALNGIANEAVTGNFALVSSSGGNPARSVFWMEPNGTEHLLSSPGFATPSGIAVHENPAVFGNGSGTVSDYPWVLAPNPGGLPLVGNQSFSVTLDVPSTMPASMSLSLLSLARNDAPFVVEGVDVWVDLGSLLATVVGPGFPPLAFSLPIPNDQNLVGATLYAQILTQERDGTLSGSPGLSFSIN